MARHGPEDVDGEKGPVRTCALTRERLPVERLIRFVIGPQDAVVPDLRHRLPGRGVWIGASAARVAEAVKRKVAAFGVAVPSWGVGTGGTRFARFPGPGEPRDVFD